MKKLSILFLIFATLLCLNANAESAVPNAIHDTVNEVLGRDWAPKNVEPRVLEKAEGETMLIKIKNNVKPRAISFLVYFLTVK